MNPVDGDVKVDDGTNTRLISHFYTERNQNYESTIFVKEVPTEFICPIHFGILKNPTECANGHLICEDCIIRWWQHSKGIQSCPVCKVEGDFGSSLSARAMINNLDVKCSNHPDCDWKGKYMNIAAHINGCQFEQVKCRNSPCTAYMQRQRIVGHETDECLYRKVPCQYCSQKCVFNQLELHFLSKCPQYDVHCECGLTLKRSELAKHLEDVCPNAVVSCPFKVHGCKNANMYRHEFALHQATEATYHAELLAAKLSVVCVQQEEYAQMSEERLKLVEKRLVNYVNSAEQSMVSIETTLLEKIRRLEQTVADLTGKLESKS